MALDQLHREEGPEVGEGAQLVDRHDAGVLELAADLGLLDEAADHVGVVAEVVAQHLEGDVAAEVGVAALEDGAHAAAGDLAVDAVADRAVVIVASPAAGRSARAPRRAPVSRSRTRGTGPIEAAIESRTPAAVVASPGRPVGSPGDDGRERPGRARRSPGGSGSGGRCPRSARRRIPGSGLDGSWLGLREVGQAFQPDVRADGANRVGSGWKA